MPKLWQTPLPNGELATGEKTTLLATEYFFMNATWTSHFPKPFIGGLQALF